MDVKEVYPDAFQSSYSDVYDYDPMISALGEVIVQVDDDDYQGDTRVLLKSDRGYGWLIFGWGSCSGCDALQACRSYEELQELADSLERDVEWHFDKQSLLERFETKEWNLEYSYHAKETQDFIQQVKDFCKEV